MVTIIVFALLVLIPIVFTSLWWAWGLIVAIVIDLILAALSIRIVRPNRVMAVEFLGKYTRILRPGFHMIIPFVEWTREQDLFKKNFSVEVEWVTSDNVTAKVNLNVVYYVEDDKDDSKNWNIYKSVYEIDDPRTLMKATIDEQLRWMIFHFTHKEIFWKREEIGMDIEERLRDKLWQFGYKIDSIQVQNIELDPSVMRAMNKEVETAKLKNAAYNEAEAKKIMKVKAAEADKEAQILLGKGMAGQRMEIAKWFKESIDMIKAADKDLTANDILQFLLDSSRIETLAKVAKDNAKIVYLNESLEWRKNTESKLIAGSDIMNK
jgi:regulator of protease activity HflC (stomatin/prohibitin superfamily)